MHWSGWVVVALAAMEAGWFAFDGAHALIMGDYITPSSGDFAGKLGPWSQLVTAIGIDPRSSFMKLAHVVIGVVWLCMILAYVMRAPWAWTGMLVCAALGLWYLPVGTVLSLLQIVILLLPQLRVAQG